MTMEMSSKFFLLIKNEDSEKGGYYHLIATRRPLCKLVDGKSLEKSHFNDVRIRKIRENLEEI